MILLKQVGAAVLVAYLIALAYSAATERTEPRPFYWSTPETGGPWPCYWRDANGEQATRPCPP